MVCGIEVKLVSLDCAVQGRNEMACGRCPDAFVETSRRMRLFKTARLQVTGYVITFGSVKRCLELGSSLAVKRDVGGKSEGEGQTCDF
jgi:hypothetical protein